MPPTLEESIKPTPELLYLLCGDPVELSAVLAGMQPPDIAEALRELEPEAAAKVLAALPFDLAVQIFDEPELVQHRAAIVAKMSDRDAADLVDAMSADQQADLFRELEPASRARLLQSVTPETRAALRLLLQYQPDTAADLVDAMSADQQADLFRELEPASRARLLQSVTPETRAALRLLLQYQPDTAADLVDAMSADQQADLFRELEPASRARLLQSVTPETRAALRLLLQYQPDTAADLVDAMSADQQADLFRELEPASRARLLQSVTPETRAALRLLLQYQPDTAGGIMTTEFVSVPADWTAERTLAHVRQVGGRKETVYAIYVTDPAARALVHVVSLRELVMAEPATPVREVGTSRTPLTVRPQTDREEVARLISKYNLLAMPVVDEEQHILGIVTVDDVIDALVKEETEDVQKFGGREALAEPYTEISFLKMVKKRAGWLCALFLGEMLTATAMSI